MPYKSKAQMRKFYAMEDRGEIPEGTADRWKKHTPDVSKLPEKKRKKKGQVMFTDEHVVRAIDKYSSIANLTESEMLVDELKRVKTAAGHEKTTAEDVDRAIENLTGGARKHAIQLKLIDQGVFEKGGMVKAANAWLEKNSAAAWAKKLVKKYKNQGKTVPEWLDSMVNGKEKQAMEKLAVTGRLMAGLGRSMMGGRAARMMRALSPRLGRWGQRMGRRLGRFGGKLEAMGGLRTQIPRNIRYRLLDPMKRLFGRFRRPVAGAGAGAGAGALIPAMAGRGGRAAAAGRALIPFGGARTATGRMAPRPSLLGRMARGLFTTRPGLLATGAGLGGLTAAGVGAFGGEEPAPAEQLAAEKEPDFVQRMMGGLGDYLGEELGWETLGRMVRENPYASLGVGAGGGGLLLYLLYQLLSGGFGRGRQQPQMPMYGYG